MMQVMMMASVYVAQGRRLFEKLATTSELQQRVRTY